MRAIADSMWKDRHPTGKPTQKINFYGAMIHRLKANQLRDEAAFWLTLDNPDFRQVCAFCGLNPDHVRRLTRKATELNDADKERWAAADLSLRDLREDSELRH